VPEHHQDERIIALPMTTVSPGGRPKLINFLFGGGFFNFAENGSWVFFLDIAKPPCPIGCYRLN
jgi:hypothetical protein